MANFFKDNLDLQYYIEKGIDWEPLVEVTEYGYRTKEGFQNAPEAVATYREMLELVGEFVAEEVAPHAAALDGIELTLKDGEAVIPPVLSNIFKQIKELDLHGMALPRELGGMNMPLLLYSINAELFSRADVSVMAHHSFHGGIAMAMLALSMLEGSTEVDPATAAITKTRFAKEIAEIVRGAAWGCMDITEPDAGSDMGALRTFAEQDEDGTWRITGQKIFITSGHGKYHFVIARSEKGNTGLAGLSMFLVPTYIDNPDGTRTRLATIDRIEDKLGHHGSLTAAISFERTPAMLVGKRGEGFRYMLHLMNNARILVGFEALGLCENIYRTARDYAAGRPSMGKTIDRHEIIADYLDEMEVDILGLRALSMYGAVHQEMGEKLELMSRYLGDDIGRKRMLDNHRAIARRVTPLIKYFGAEKAVEMARRCLQIHGGNGYMKEYSPQRLLRDSLVLPIYEGTSQIQSLMAMKDVLSGIIRNPQEFVKRVAQTRWRALSARDSLDRRVARIQQLSLSAQQHLVTRTAASKLRSLTGLPLPSWPREFLRNWDPKRDFAYATLHAERLIRILCDEAISEVLLDQARRHPERREILERFLDRAEPRCRYFHDEILTTGQRLLSRLSEKEAQDSQEKDADSKAQAVG